jgi:hypothetical protein
MTKWQYCKIDLNDLPRKTDDVDVLNDAGHEGWELVGITANNFAYLKRQISMRPSLSPPASTTRATTKNT